MSSRRKAKLDRKARMLAEGRPKPLWKRMRLWAAGMVLACAAGAFAVSRLAREPEVVPVRTAAKTAFASKSTVSEGIMGGKRRLHINLITHRTAEEINCSLGRTLDKVKPSYVFIENANALHTENVTFEALFNDRTLSETNLFSSYTFLQPGGMYSKFYKTLHEYIGKSGARFFHAESYSPEEAMALRKLLMRDLHFEGDAFRVFKEGKTDDAVALWSRKTRSYAPYYNKRNDRIVETVSRKWTDSDAVGMLNVGMAHRGVAGLFEKRGYGIELTGFVGGGRLEEYYGALERGWKPLSGFEEPSESAGTFLCAFVSAAYDSSGIGSSGAAYELCQRIVKRLDLDKLKAIRTCDSWPKVIECLQEKGYEFPKSKQEFERKAAELGICY